MGRKKEEIIIKETPYVKHSKEHALKLSIAEGSAYAVASSTSRSFVTPFMLAVGGNSFHVGLMSALSGLIGPLGQWRGSKEMETYSRKKMLLWTKLVQVLLWGSIITLAYLFWKGLFVRYLPYALILLWAVLIQFVWGIGHVAWFSWMGDLVPADKKGKYFAIRNRTTGIVGLVAFLLAAFFLDVYKTKGFVLLGFSILFIISLVFRLISRSLASKVFNPKFKVTRGYYFSFRDFIKRYDNFGKFAFFQAVLFFGFMMSAPFFAVYMLEDLGFSYFSFTLVSISSIGFYLLFTPLAGKFSDKYGNVKLFYIAATLFPIVPLLWLFFETPLALILLPGLIAGIANAAYIIGITDFTYDAVPPQKRGLCVAYTGILVGIGMLTGSLIGGFLIEYASFSFIEPIFFVFILSALVMVMTSLFFLPQIKDERRTQKVRGLSHDIHHPFKMVHSDVVWFKNFIHDK
jgi:MFS family permease